MNYNETIKIKGYTKANLEISSSWIKLGLAIDSFIELSDHHEQLSYEICERSKLFFDQQDETFQYTGMPYYDLFTDKRESFELNEALEFFFNEEEN